MFLLMTVEEVSSILARKSSEIERKNENFLIQIGLYKAPHGRPGGDVTPGHR